MDPFQDSILGPDDVARLVYHHYPEYDGKPLTITPLMGMTNLTFKVFAEDMSLVVRIFLGKFDRKNENTILKELSDKGIAPRCYFMT